MCREYDAYSDAFYDGYLSNDQVQNLAPVASLALLME